VQNANIILAFGFWRLRLGPFANGVKTHANSPFNVLLRFSPRHLYFTIPSAPSLGPAAVGCRRLSTFKLLPGCK